MSHEFTMSRLIDATPDEVWDALTDPAAQMQWWEEPGGIVRAECDLCVGGEGFVEWGPDEATLCRATQRFVEIDRPHRLVLKETVYEPHRTALVYECEIEWSLEEQQGKTLFTIHHTGFPSTEERDLHERGTGAFLDRMQRHVQHERSAR